MNESNSDAAGQPAILRRVSQTLAPFSLSAETLPCAAFFILTLPWLFCQLRYSIIGDPAYLTLAAEHVLAGQRMVDAYFDNNPPMSYLIYIPAVLLGKLGIPLWYAINIYICSILGASLALTAAFLKRWPGLDRAVYWGILACYFVLQSIMARDVFGTKDHLIAAVLVPFLLAQAEMTLRPGPSWAVRAAILIGTPFLLLKPQYFLLPAVMLLHRLIKQKRWTAVFDFDALTLGAGVVLYAAVIVVRFGDFLHEALKAILSVYISHHNTLSLLAFALIFIADLAALMLLAWPAEKSNPYRPVILFSGFLGVLAMLCFLVQGKGYFTHALPTACILWPALFMAVTLHIDAYRKNNARWAFATVLSIFYTGYFIATPNPHYLTHAGINKSFWAQYIHDHAGKPGDRFYIETTSTDTSATLSLYTGVPVASRFSFPWFLPGLQDLEENHSTEKLNYWRGIFARYIAEDMSRNKPAFVALIKNSSPDKDYLAMFKTDPAFAREWSHYQKEDEAFLNCRKYPGTPCPHKYIHYDIYYRIP